MNISMYLMGEIEKLSTSSKDDEISKPALAVSREDILALLKVGSGHESGRESILNSGDDGYYP